METLNELDTQNFIYALTAPMKENGAWVCLAARQSGLYISEDGCRTWRMAFASLNLDSSPPATCVAASPGFATDRMLFVGVPGGVLLSEDGGASWLSASVPSPAPLPTALVISPNFAQDQLLLLGTSEDGVLRSTNRGSSWRAWNFGLLDFNILSLAISPDFSEDQTVYAGTSTGLVISRSGGRSWHDLSLPSGSAAVLSLALSPRFGEDGRLFVGTEEAGLFGSADRGKTWTRLGEDLLNGTVNHILVSASGPDELWVVHEDALYHSSDGGGSWSVMEDEGVACIAALPGSSPGTLLVGKTDGSVDLL